MAVEKAEADTFPKLLLHHSKQRGDHPAIRVKTRGIWRTTTWRELADEAAALAARCRRAGCSAAGMSPSSATTGHGSMPRCARRNGWARSPFRCTRTPRLKSCRADPARQRHPHLRRGSGAGRQAARNLAALSHDPMHRLRQRPRHASLQAAGTCQLRRPCCSRAAIWSPQSGIPAGRGRARRRSGRGLRVLYRGHDRPRPKASCSPMPR